MSSIENPLSITKDEVNRLELARYTQFVHIVSTHQALALAVRELEQEPLLGFDTESRPSFRKGQNFPPSLIQIATSRAVYLIQLGRLDGIQELIRVLESPRILKVGVALHDDIRRLRQMYDFEPGGFVDVADIARELGVEKTGLRSLAGIFLKVRISKNAQLSNWARSQLTRKQICYAATDAWISRELYLRISQAADLQSA